MLNPRRVLLPLLGTDRWEKDRHYAVVPAAIVMGAPATHALLTNPNGDDTGDLFRSVVLGQAVVTRVESATEEMAPVMWAARTFVLRQNLLFEHDGDGPVDRPGAKGRLGPIRGYAHLEGCRADPHADFADALRLEFDEEPGGWGAGDAGPRRAVLLRLRSASEVDRWAAALVAASALTADDLYDVGRTVGTGRYAEVREATRRRGPWEDRGGAAPGLEGRCALKIIEKEAFWKRVADGGERQDALVREVAVQARLNADVGASEGRAVFVRIRGVFETRVQLVLELEHSGGASLFSYVKDKVVLGEAETAGIMRDVLRSIKMMQAHGIAHRDIKLANLIRDGSGGDGLTSVRLCDFGMSTFVGRDGLLRGRCGTPGYVAPEIYSAGVHGGYGPNVDVFSAGVVMYILLCGYEPFYGETDRQLIACNKRAYLEFHEGEWGHVSAKAKDLILRMMEKDTEKRIRPDEALEHQWISKNAPPLLAPSEGTIDADLTAL